MSLPSSHQRQYLQLMGVDVWVEKGIQPEIIDEPIPNIGNLNSNVDNEQTEDGNWTELRDQVKHCTNCGLHSGRTQTVFGVGDTDADWMIIGEAPGKEEDRQGEPFVGRAGQLLNSMLEAIGLDRKKVFIANILKCRPPNNRDPKPEEVLACENYLRQQITLVKPKIILALGRIAAQNLLKVDTPIGRMRGQKYDYPEPHVPVVVTYHPAYLLRSPKEKRKSWQDLQMAMKIFKESEK